MPLEDLIGPNKFIDDLVKEWPLGVDPFAEGDDHIRGVKNVLVNSFPTISEARRPVSFREGAGLAAELVSAVEMAAGTTAQRPSSPQANDQRFNTETGFVEIWDGVAGAWFNLFALTNVENVFIPDSSAGGLGPVTQYSGNKVPAVDDIFTQMVFNCGDGPGGINQGSFRWQVAPDSTGKHRFALRTNNSGFGNRLVVGAGVMAPLSDQPADAFDLGRGTINTEAGCFRNGVEYQAGWTWADEVALSGGSHLLATEADNPGLAAADEIEVVVSVSSNSGSNEPRIRLGTGGSVVSTGYNGSSGIIQSGTANCTNYDDCFGLYRSVSYNSGNVLEGVGIIRRASPTGNRYKWDANTVRNPAANTVGVNVSDITLAGALDRVAIEADSTANLSGTARLRFR